jgi:hypothetical protein
MFDGVGDGADLGVDRVKLSLALDGARTLYSPRRFVGPGIGATHLRPAGTRINFGGETYTLERGDS